VLYLDIEDDVDGEGEVGSRESRGSDMLELAIIKLTALHLEVIYNKSYSITIKFISIINNSASSVSLCLQLTHRRNKGSKRNRGGAT